MRLLNTENLQLVEFTGNLPEYAILSHTWGPEEISYQELLKGPDQDKKGWKKIVNACGRAAHDGWEFLWIDTCCIDKSSSSELSEAINSMYEWYERSAICYAHLADVDAHSRRDPYDELAHSRWFTRGWTLQELLAPSYILFVDQSWIDIGTRDSLSDAIEKITHISKEDMKDPKMCCTAQKLSWAASRKTERIEDSAYCLMGLFEINMPLLYGEGVRSFRRLQEEIIKSSDDTTIFIWRAKQTYFRGFLAPSLHCFDGLHQVRVWLPGRPEFSLTKGGLSINPLLYELASLETQHKVFLAQIDYGWRSSDGNIAQKSTFIHLDFLFEPNFFQIRKPEAERNTSTTIASRNLLGRLQIIINDIKDDRRYKRSYLPTFSFTRFELPHNIRLEWVRNQNERRKLAPQASPFKDSYDDLANPASKNFPPLSCHTFRERTKLAHFAFDNMCKVHGAVSYEFTLAITFDGNRLQVVCQQPETEIHHANPNEPSQFSRQLSLGSMPGSLDFGCAKLTVCQRPESSKYRRVSDSPIVDGRAFIVSMESDKGECQQKQQKDCDPDEV